MTEEQQTSTDDMNAEGATNYLPPEDVEQHDDVADDKPAE